MMGAKSRDPENSSAAMLLQGVLLEAGGWTFSETLKMSKKSVSNKLKTAP